MMKPEAKLHKLYQKIKIHILELYDKAKQAVFRKFKTTAKNNSLNNDDFKKNKNPNLTNNINNKIRDEDEKFVSDSKSALMEETSVGANRIMMAIVIFIIIGIVWAAFSEIDQTVRGVGTVIPSSRVKIIQSLDGGIIKEIFVREGEIVQKNQKLLEMDVIRYKAEYEQLYAQYISLLAMVARLKAETENKEEINFPKELISGQKIMQNEKQEIMQNEVNLFKARKNALSDELRVLKSSLDLATKELEMYRPLVKTGVSSQLELLRAERSVNELQSRIYEKEGKFRESAWTDLNQKQSDLESLQEKLLGLKDKMDRTLLTSPVYGIIKKINIVTLGGVIQPAANIMEIVPLEDTLLVQAQISSEDIAFIYVGAPATVKIDAYDYSIFGDLKGKVEYVSADIIEESVEKNGSSKRGMNLNRFYLVNIRTKNDYLTYHNKTLPIIPGMSTTVQITINKRTLLEYILKPLIKIKTEALRER